MEKIDQQIEEERKKNLQPNYRLADLLRQKINSLGWGVADKKEGSYLYKL